MSFASEYQYPEWYNEKLQTFYKKKLEQIIKSRKIHADSEMYYSKLHLKIYTPSIVITGGKTMHRPYVSSSNYILKMSSYKKDEWDELYDSFLKKNKKKLGEV
jgi:hypothetical protein